ncbi:Thymidylate synthase [Streptomyces antimycoticus]
MFNFAEALWYLSGRDDLAFPAHYAPSLTRYSVDGRHLTGTAYGPRIFRHGPGALDQWAAVTETIRKDPDTKRAIIQIFEPRELLVPANPDVACTLALQFLLREGRLHAVAYMRANDAYRGMVSDVFSFTFLQEAMARQLRVPVGTYTHVAGSLHLYRPDVQAAARLVADGTRGDLPPTACPRSPKGTTGPMSPGCWNWRRRCARARCVWMPTGSTPSACPSTGRRSSPSSNSTGGHSPQSPPATWPTCCLRSTAA